MSLSPVLVVEDSDEDYQATLWAMQKLGRSDLLERCTDGDDALDRLSDRARPWPKLVLLDLNMPGTDGREVLAFIRSTPFLRPLPVVILSTSASERDVNTCYDLGANAYLLKPVNFTQYTEQLRVTLDFWLGLAQLPEPVESA
ncbi:response regulator [Deinococcus knuensis]|uniref:Two-component system response regulator n=1 Tax=Deinococcus knuensis TaxID=1837380 RepID=A0ABQ2SG85_9DEIO|nr:response regulator [Deinococcus knuensis]GGS21916.1 two-component system response regulator [Deinococcus knuensis]